MVVVSVIMPVYNAQGYVNAAIRSILGQSAKKWEFLIVDDASTDTSGKIIRKFTDPRIKILKNKRKLGVARSLNIALERARGNYIARMDADDISLPERLAIQVSYLTTHPNIGVVGSWVFLIDEKGKLIGEKHLPITPEAVKRQLSYVNPFIHSSVMFRKQLFTDYGGYDPRLEGAEDYDLWMRYLRYSKGINLPQILLKYRLTQKSVSSLESARLNRAYARTQFKKVRDYGYPTWQIVFALKAYMSALIPYHLKKILYRIFFHN